MSESWVINASPVILLAKAGLMEHVAGLVPAFVIPEPVALEISSVRGEDAATEWLKNSGRKFVHPATAELPALIDTGIGAGERSVISWAATHPGFTAVLDDREARSIAQRLGVKVFGTVGMVIRLKKAGRIAEVKSHLFHIKRVGGFISDELLHEALRNAGESL